MGNGLGFMRTWRGLDPVLRFAQNRKTLYISRPLMNSREFSEWARGEGFDSLEQESEMHVTIAFSTRPVEWSRVGPAPRVLVVRGGAREVIPLGKDGAVVLSFESDLLRERHAEIKASGASWNHDTYRPHITITYQGEGIDLEKVTPFRGDLAFGPEEFEEVE